jgi:adenosine deaminase
MADTVEPIATAIARLPKTELHIHIEGSLEPEMLFALAERNRVALPYTTVEDVKKAYNFSKLQDFLDIYYKGMSVLQTEEDFFDLAWAYLERVGAQGVTHAEIFFDPQGHTERGIAFATVFAGLERACVQARERLGLEARLILCFLRHLSEAAAECTLDEALPYKERILGVGLDSSELGHPPSKFRNVFRRAREAGFKLVAHAGEEGPPDYVWEALEVLGVDRIDHGNRAMEDRELVRRLARDQVALTVCPLSNLRLCVVDDLARHPLPAMLDAGLRATVNSDDPAYFGGYLEANYQAVAAALDLDLDAVTTLARNGYLGSFLDDRAKTEALTAFDAAAAAL